MEKHNLRMHSSGTVRATPNTAAVKPSVLPAEFSAIDSLTGRAYMKDAITKSKIISCPWGSICGPSSDGLHLESNGGGSLCPYIFGRFYDLRRHLRSAHDSDVSIEELKAILFIDQGNVP